MRLTAQEAADHLGLNVGRIRRWVAAGWIEPEAYEGRSAVFGFNELVLLRTAKRLLDSGSSPQNVRAALQLERQNLPPGRPLTSRRLGTSNRRVVVLDDGHWWDVVSGQAQLELEGRSPSPDHRPPATGRDTVATLERPVTDTDWFSLALQLDEQGQAEQAIKAYAKALLREENYLEASLNMGRLLQEQGAVDQAIGRYREIVAREPSYLLARFNLGTAYEELGRIAEAETEYEQASVEIPDACFNLARLSFAAGDVQAALRRLADYRRATS